MFKLTNTVTGLATLALAALPVLALTSAAHAAPMTVKVGDLSASAGVVAFEQRLDRASAKICADQKLGAGPRVVNTAACVAAVRAEAVSGLSDSQRSMIAASGRSEFAAR